MMQRFAGMPNRVEPLERRCLLASVPITFGGSHYDSGFVSKVDSDGNIVVAGIFSLTANFDPSKSGQFLLTSVGESDAFVAKYSPTGQLIWAERFGGGSGQLTTKSSFSPVQQTVGELVNKTGPALKGAGEYVNNLAIGPANTIYLTGSFLGTADFDPGPAQFNIRSKGFDDIYVLKLNSDGSFVWARSFGGVFEDTGKSIAVDSLGNAVVTGRFTRSGDFNPTKTGVLTLKALGRDDAFVMELSSAGKIVWAERFGSTAVDYNQRDSGEDIALDAAGANIYVTGSFSRTPDFDPGPAKFPLSSSGDTDIFLLKLTFTGAFVWAERMGGDHFDGGNDIAVASDGSIFTAGYFSRTADLDPGPAVLNFVANDSSDIEGTKTDIYISHLNSDGTLIWTKQLSGAGFEWLGRMALDSASNVLVTGAFAGMLTLNPTATNPTTIASVKGTTDFPDDHNRKFSYDILEVTLDSAGDLSQFNRFGSASDDYGVGIALDSSEDPVLSGRFQGTVNFGTKADPRNKKSRGVTDVFALVDPALNTAPT